MSGIDNDMLEGLAEGAAQAAPNLADIKATASKLVGLQALRDGLEEQIKSISAELHTLKHDTLPTMMASAGLASIKLDDGATIKIDDFCSGSLPKEPEKRQQAIDWLVANGAEGIIKANVTVAFGRSEINVAKATQAMLKDEGLDAELVESVHPQTYAAFGRERIRNGEAIPDILGLFVGRVAKVKS
jgi:hypothetical protein